MKKNVVLIVITALLSLSLSGCARIFGNSEQDMLDDYNGGFTTEYVDIEDLQPGDDGFDPASMLYDEYFVYADGTLNLAAPSRCLTYEWKLTDPVNDNEVVKVKTLDNTLIEKFFRVYIPDSGLETGKTYKLTLTIMGYKGGIYSDSCGIVVYQHYSYEYWEPIY